MPIVIKKKTVQELALEFYLCMVKGNGYAYYLRVNSPQWVIDEFNSLTLSRDQYNSYILYHMMQAVAHKRLEDINPKDYFWFNINEGYSWLKGLVSRHYLVNAYLNAKANKNEVIRDGFEGVLNGAIWIEAKGILDTVYYILLDRIKAFNDIHEKDLP